MVELFVSSLLRLPVDFSVMVHFWFHRLQKYQKEPMWSLNNSVRPFILLNILVENAEQFGTNSLNVASLISVNDRLDGVVVIRTWFCIKHCILPEYLLTFGQRASTDIFAKPLQSVAEGMNHDGKLVPFQFFILLIILLWRNSTFFPSSTTCWLVESSTLRRMRVMQLNTSFGGPCVAFPMRTTNSLMCSIRVFNSAIAQCLSYSISNWNILSYSPKMWVIVESTKKKESWLIVWTLG